MSCPDTLTIEGVTYQKKTDPTDKPLRIVILQRGWVMIGRWSQDGDDCLLEDAKVIRVWGTKHGLGQLALQGKQTGTVLDPCGTVRFHQLTTVAVLDCDESKW